MRLSTLITFLGGLGLCACSQGKPAPYEKGGPVTEIGFVSLSPPTSYSPVRGVICESYSLAEDGSATGECYDLSGPSVALTEQHISPQAAVKLQTDIDEGRFTDPLRFRTGSDLVCDLESKECWFVREGNVKIPAPKHSQALFWNDGAKPASGGPYKIINGMVTGGDTETYSQDFESGEAVTITLTSPSTFVFFNIIPPDGKPYQASFVGTMDGDEWSETLSQSGAYDILVYHRGAAKDDGQTNRFDLTIDRKMPN